MKLSSPRVIPVSRPGLTFVWMLGLSSTALAAPYGNPDARSQAMGGTGVASADNAYSAYFNPALPAAYSQRKHRGGNQRIVFPQLSASATDNVEVLYDIDDADYEDELDRAVDEFNSGGEAEDLLAVLTPLEEDLERVSDAALDLDASAGLVVTIPDQREGGAFSITRRAFLDGQVEYRPEDAALLTAYVEELDFVRDGGLPGTLHPELYAGGELIEPTDDLLSTARAAGLVMDELAFSMAWQIEAWGQNVMLGFSPKLVSVTTYEYQAVATSSDLTERGELDNRENFNLDIGYAQRLGERLTLGLAAKNIISQDYETESGAVLELEPHLRAGMEYRSDWGTFTADLDLLENDALAGGDGHQDLGLGAEWAIGAHRLRAGVFTNLAAEEDNEGFGYSLGFRLRLLGLFADLSAAEGAGRRSAALQFGLQF